jgi:hypothetical protein
MKKTSKATNQGARLAYSFAEFADKVGKERTWIYRQVKKGRIRAITGFGAAMIPAAEIDRIFGTEVTK